MKFHEISSLEISDFDFTPPITGTRACATVSESDLEEHPCGFEGAFDPADSSLSGERSTADRMRTLVMPHPSVLDE